LYPTFFEDISQCLLALSFGGMMLYAYAHDEVKADIKSFGPSADDAQISNKWSRKIMIFERYFVVD